MRRSFTDAELSACAEREVRYRRRTYARLQMRGDMRPDEAEREIEMMAEIRDVFAAMAEAKPRESGRLL